MYLFCPAALLNKDGSKSNSHNQLKHDKEIKLFFIPILLVKCTPAIFSSGQQGRNKRGKAISSVRDRKERREKLGEEMKKEKKRKNRNDF